VSGPAPGAVVLPDPATFAADPRPAPDVPALRLATVLFVPRADADFPAERVPARAPRPADLAEADFFLRLLGADFAFAVEEAVFLDARFTVFFFVVFLDLACLATWRTRSSSTAQGHSPPAKPGNQQANPASIEPPPAAVNLSKRTLGAEEHVDRDRLLDYAR
jgi:hypothetical protein